MQVQASALRTGDRIRGIGLTVEFVEPQSDFTTYVTGTVSVLASDTAEVAEYETYAASAEFPNQHRVNVRRPFQPTDRVTVPATYLDASALEVAEMLGTAYIEVEVDEVRPDERQVVVFDPTSELPLEERERFAVPFRSARHAV